MAGEILGSATLELDVDLAPLDAGLARAEQRVAQKVAVMQAMLDSLHGEVEMRVAALEAVAGRLNGTAPGRTAPAAAATVGRNEIWGIRGSEHPGSLTNPIVTVLAAGKLYPMGSYASALGDDNVADAQRGEQSSGLATEAELAALTGAVSDLAHNASAMGRLAQAGQNGLGSERREGPLTVSLNDPESRALRDMAAALGRIESRSNSNTRTFLIPGGGGGSRMTVNENATTVFAGRGGGAQTSAVPVIFSSGGGGGGGGGIPVALGGAGGGGNRRVDIFYHSSNEGGGGRSVLPAILGLGTGALGLAGFGSLASFAGLGPEHVLMTLLGLAGSAVGGGIGAGILGLGAAGVAGTGMATDLAGMGQAANDIKSVVQAQNSLNQAIAVYGKNSTQAKQAQAQLNATLDSFSPIAKRAVLAAANTAQGFHQQFNQATGAAEAIGAQILDQAMLVGEKFLPTLGHYAAENMVAIQHDLQPLFAWLTGPQGMGIFNNLEQIFQQNLPYAMGAFDNGVELLLRIIDLAAQHTGGFTRELDKLLTRWNSMSNAQLGSFLDKFIHDFELWKALVEALIRDIYDLFHNDAGTASAIVVYLTQMLDKLGQWERSTQGSRELHTIFEVHKQEIMQILQLLPLLAKGFGSLYLEAAPPLTEALTEILKLISGIVNGIANIGPGSATILALTLLAAKFKLLTPGFQMLLKLGGVNSSTPILGKFLGGAGGGNIMGVNGPTGAGSAANPIAVTGMGAGGGPAGPVATAAEGAGGASILDELGGAATEGVGAGLIARFVLAGAFTQGGIVAAAGVATAIAAVTLHNLVHGGGAFPTVLPTNKVIAAVAPTPLTNPYNPLRQVSGNFGTTNAGAVGGPSAASISQQTRDYLALSDALSKLESHQSGIAATARALNQFSQQAARTGDIRWSVADSLAAELLTTRSVASKGVQTLIGEFGKLPPGVKAQTVEASVQMVGELRQMGVLSKGQAADLITQLLGTFRTGFGSMNATASADWAQFAAHVAVGMIAAGTATNAGIKEITVEVNKALGLFGGQTLSLATIAAATPSQLAAVAQGQVSPGALASPHATGGKVTSPMIIVGEEAPVHPEWVIASNPAYRERNLGLWTQAGHALGVPGFATGGVTAPHVHGGGALGTVDNAALGKVAAAAIAYLAGKGGGSGGGGGGISTSGLSGSLVQIVRQISGQKGWNANDWLAVISLESGGSMTARNPSSGAYGIAQFINGPAEYAQWGGNVNTLAGQLVAMANYIAARYGSPSAALAHEHAFHWYRKGGRIPGLRGGGVWAPGGFGTGGFSPSVFSPSTLSAATSNFDLQSINRGMAGIAALIGPDGDVNKLTDLMSFWQGMWALNQQVSSIMSGGPTAAIVTNPTTGAQAIDQADVATAIAQLTQETTWQGSIVGDLNSALALSWAMPPQIQQAIARRQARIKRIRARIRANLKKIAQLQKQINQLQVQINTEQGKKNPNYHAIAAWRNKIVNLQGQISALQGENQQLGGSQSSVGTGGEIGAITGEISGLQGQLQTAQGYPDQIAGAGASGFGGQLGPARTTLAQLEQELAALSPSALSAALAAAQASGQSGGASQSALTSLLEQQNATLYQQLQVSQAQYAVLAGPVYGLPAAGLPRFGGSFARGGVVPGWPGEPRTIVAHGGERVSPAGGEPVVELHFASGMEWLGQFVTACINKQGRKQALTARRRLPGRPGALLPV